jgi:hypothetical protein
MRLKLFLPLLLPCLFFISVNGQDKDKSPVVKYGKISPSDFVITSPLIDTNANAVTLFDVGSSGFEGNTDGWFSIITKRHCRIKILNKNGFDAADIIIRLYKADNVGGGEEKVTDLKGATYNLENGNIVTTKLESKSVFTETVDRYRTKKKFTFPELKEGSIIEFSYTISSDFLFTIQPWIFQNQYPCIWSEYETSIPDFFNYAIIPQGSLNYFLSKNEDGREEDFNIIDRRQMGGTFGKSDRYTIKGRLQNHKWIMKDIPGMKAESFTTTIKNYIARIEFQLSQYRFPNTLPKSIMSTWPVINAELLGHEHLGAPINRPNEWLNDEMKPIIEGAKNKSEVAYKIYEYVRDNFVTKSEGILLSEGTSLKDVFKKKNGCVADINLLLITMLRHEGIPAHPVILSTRENGITHPLYPLMDRFNYLICQAEINDRIVYLDATEPNLGFGMLPISCFNGSARVISKTPSEIILTSDSVRENKTTTIFITNDDKGKPIGSYTSTLGNYASLDLRNELAKTQKDVYFKTLAASYPSEIKVENLIIDSLKKYEAPVGISYDLKLNLGDADILYLNPMLNQGVKKNPFKSSQRLYPIEMPYVPNETFILNMEIPKGYKVEELPKSIRLRLNSEDGMFEYIISEQDHHIQLQCRLVLSKAYYQTEDYQTLRDFYTAVIKQESEQIVFKKIK